MLGMENNHANVLKKKIPGLKWQIMSLKMLASSL